MARHDCHSGLVSKCLGLPLCRLRKVTPFRFLTESGEKPQTAISVTISISASVELKFPVIWGNQDVPTAFEDRLPQRRLLVVTATQSELAWKTYPVVQKIRCTCRPGPLELCRLWKVTSFHRTSISRGKTQTVICVTIPINTSLDLQFPT